MAAAYLRAQQALEESAAQKQRPPQRPLHGPQGSQGEGTSSQPGARRRSSSEERRSAEIKGDAPELPTEIESEIEVEIEIEPELPADAPAAAEVHAPPADGGVRRRVPSVVQREETRSEACSALQTVARRHQAVVRLVREQMTQMGAAFPRITRVVQTQYATNVLLRHQRHVLLEARDAGKVSEADAAKLVEEVSS